MLRGTGAIMALAGYRPPGCLCSSDLQEEDVVNLDRMTLHCEVSTSYPMLSVKTFAKAS